MRTFRQVILEMSFRSKFIKQRVIDLEHEINNHLTKIFVFGKSTSLHHWEKEIINHIEKINVDVKTRKKRLSFDTYYECLYKNPFEHNEIEHTKRKVNFILAIEEDEIPTVTINSSLYTKLHLKIKEFHLELSKLLSKNEFYFDKWKQMMREFVK